MNIRVKKRSYLLISIGLIILSVSGLVFSMFLFAASVEQVLKWTIPLKPGAISRKFYLEVPFPLEFHCHVFSIENPKEVQNGGKPVLKDVGPYVFHEYILKHDTVDDEENDTLTYTLKKTWIFKPELSNGLTGNENITILHPVINALALTVNVDRKVFLKLAAGVIAKMYKPTTPFWTGRAMDLFFDGLEIDCTHTSFAVKTVCSIMGSGEISAIRPMPEKKNFFKFSLLGPYNDSFNGRFTVMRGKNNLHDVARLVEIDGNASPVAKSVNGTCPIEGTLDLFNCMGVPIVASLPHFLDAHPSLLENVASGLEPKREDHEIYASVDLETGVPLEGVKRLQFNFEVIPLKEVKVMKKLRNMLFPLAWIEERAKLPGLYVTGMQCLFLTRLSVTATKYLCMTLIPLIAMVSMAVHCLIAMDKIQVIDTSPTTPMQSSTGSVKSRTTTVESLPGSGKSNTSSLKSKIISVKSATSTISSIASSASSERSPTGSVNIHEVASAKGSNNSGSKTGIPAGNFQFVN